MSFKTQGLTAANRLFIDHDGSGNEVIKAELKNSNGTKRIVTLAEAE